MEAGRSRSQLLGSVSVQGHICQRRGLTPSGWRGAVAVSCMQVPAAGETRDLGASYWID